MCIPGDAIHRSAGECIDPSAAHPSANDSGRIVAPPDEVPADHQIALIPIQAIRCSVAAKVRSSIASSMMSPLTVCSYCVTVVTPSQHREQTCTFTHRRETKAKLCKSAMRQTRRGAAFTGASWTSQMAMCPGGLSHGIRWRIWASTSVHRACMTICAALTSRHGGDAAPRQMISRNAFGRLRAMSYPH